MPNKKSPFQAGFAPLVDHAKLDKIASKTPKHKNKNPSTPAENITQFNPTYSAIQPKVFCGVTALHVGLIIDIRQAMEKVIKAAFSLATF